MKKFNYIVSSTALTADGAIDLAGAAAVILINKGDKPANIDIGDNATVDLTLDQDESLSLNAPEGEFTDQDISCAFGVGDTANLVIMKTTRESVLQAE